MIEDLVTHEDIVHLIDEDINQEDAASLIYTQIFPYEYLPEVTETAKTFVCCEVDIQRVMNKTFLIPTLYIWVFTHESKLRLSEGGVRTDKLCSEICSVIDGSRHYGLGELNLYSVKRFAPMSNFNGKLMTFQATEFNRQYDGRRDLPSNRKTG
ncbi:MAG: hypothetical protein LUD72_03505 [Bacteroidales bacterium]|nr:hypothetical protein [Bacteroidales bacterium]